MSIFPPEGCSNLDCIMCFSSRDKEINESHVCSPIPMPLGELEKGALGRTKGKKLNYIQGYLFSITDIDL